MVGLFPTTFVGGSDARCICVPVESVCSTIRMCDQTSQSRVARLLTNAGSEEAHVDLEADGVLSRLHMSYTVN